MTLRIDTSRAFTTHEERAALVRAVVAAQPEDELDWIEWKIAGDLSGHWRIDELRAEPAAGVQTSKAHEGCFLADLCDSHAGGCRLRVG